MGEFVSGFSTGFGSAFLQFLFERFASLGSAAWEEISLIRGVQDELRKLQRTFLKIQGLVDHMDGNRLRLLSGSNAWQIWFEDLRKLAYDADALLDHVSLHLSSYCTEHSVTSFQEKQVLSMVLKSFEEWKLPHKISKMQKKLDELAKEIESLVMIEKVKFDAEMTSASQFSNFYSTASSFVDETIMVGRGEDKQSILNLLMESDGSKFSVIPIVGMAGIGKTALARLVYDDNVVLSSFKKRIWVNVSMDFDAVRITKSMIEYATQSACNLSDLNSLQFMLRWSLHGTKFLLVLDDYWSEKHEDWDLLSWPFRFGNHGSKVILTTRSTKVSSIVSSFEAYKLKMLSQNDCWELIKKRALLSTVRSHNLEPIREQIANKCKGLPLVATTLASMMRCKSTEEEWRTMLENELWDMPQDNNIFLHLMKSYLYLPAHLQKCFSYCSIFPQNYEFDKFEIEELILLWMAEGFIQPVGARRLEDIGRDYFNDLYSRSLFQQYEIAPNETIYKMHDLTHDMARLVSKDICFHGRYDMLNCYPLFGNTCHLSLYNDTVQQLKLKASVENGRLRTFLVMSRGGGVEIDDNLFSHLQFLRVLGLSRVGLTDKDSSNLERLFGKLKYLRYLNLSVNSMSYLPKSMCKLVALQVLKLRNCFQLRELPEDMKNLLNLRHLDLDGRGLLNSMPPEFGRLTNLQSLSAYLVGRKERCGIEELENLNCLHGSLCIGNIENVSEVSKASKAKLDQKTGLDKLELQWKRLGDGLNPPLLDQRRIEQAQVLSSLQPHENLKELAIRNYCGTVYPLWLSQPQRKFTSIHLQGLKYCNNLPSLGELPFLKSFVIEDLPDLENVDQNFYGSGNFPSLVSFELNDMSNLKHWANVSNSAMPCLEKVTIRKCPNLVSLPRRLLLLPPNSITRT